MSNLLKENEFYLNSNFYNFRSYFDDLLLYTLTALEENITFSGALQFVKYLKDSSKSDIQYDSSGIDLKKCKFFYDLLKDTGFIEISFNDNAGFFDKFIIFNTINEINSIKDLVYMIDHNLTVNQFLRLTKIKRITKRNNK